jgi:membrane protease YdiL (CAAX protease family)
MICIKKEITEMKTDVLPQSAIRERMESTQVERIEKQYSLSQILWIWALASIPGALLFWLGLPVLDQITDIRVGYLVPIVVVIPYFWHFLLAFLVLKKEGGDLNWNTIKDRLRLRTTTDPRTGKRNNALWLWVIPVIAAYAVTEVVPIFQSVNDGWTRILPIHEPAQYSFDVLFENPGELVGDWGFFLIILAVSILTMSEEIIFRGILLPKMNGVFGRADWIANGFLFAFYHLDQPWTWPSKILYSTLAYALPARLFRSTWFSTAVHLSQGIFFLFLALGLVLGLA